MFDEKTQQQLNSYVYMLVDPNDKKPFYIGKGTHNRVFDHINCTINDIPIQNLKYDKIREITSNNKSVEHVILRHNLTPEEAFSIEATLIDTFNYCGYSLSNKVGGHNSIEKGLMTADEIKRLYNAKPLDFIEKDCVLININRKYKRGKGGETIYEATKEIWTIGKKRLPHLKYVLSEYRGLVVEVYKVKEWYEKERGYQPRAKKFGQTKIGYGFNGEVASEELRDKYLNKSVAHKKKKGAASAIRYNL